MSTKDSKKGARRLFNQRFRWARNKLSERHDYIGDIFVSLDLRYAVDEENSDLSFYEEFTCLSTLRKSLELG